MSWEGGKQGAGSCPEEQERALEGLRPGQGGVCKLPVSGLDMCVIERPVHLRVKAGSSCTPPLHVSWPLLSPPSPPCRYEYLWADGVSITKPIKVSAPEYVDYLMSWVDKQISDSSIFPVTTGA